MRGGSRAAAVILLLLAQLSALSHSAEVRHVRCAEHGELIDAAVVDSHVTDLSLIVAVTSGHSGDDHCALVAGLRDHATTCSAPLALSGRTVSTPIARLRLAPVRARATLYLIAPKTSPPDLRVSFTA